MELIVGLQDTEFYAHSDSITKLLQDIVLDYESDPKLHSSDRLHLAVKLLHDRYFMPEQGARPSLPHIGIAPQQFGNFLKLSPRDNDVVRRKLHGDQQL